MPPFVITLLAAFALEAAKSAGRDAGLRIMADLGPMLSKESVAQFYEEFVKRCREYVAAHPLPTDLGLPIDADENGVRAAITAQLGLFDANNPGGGPTGGMG